MTEQRLYMKDLVWEALAGPIPAGFRVSHRNGNPLDNRRQNLHLVPAEQYPGDDDQVYAPAALDHNGPRPVRKRRPR